MIARIILTITATVAALCYAFTGRVALMVSGAELSKTPWFYVVALAPLLYLAFCIVSCWWRIDARTLKKIGIVAHVLAIPIMFTSLLGFGLLLPVFALLWFFMLRERSKAQQT